MSALIILLQHVVEFGEAYPVARVEAEATTEVLTAEENLADRFGAVVIR